MATPYSFTQPIRYYKANDPYYYEVDNIPLRQLEENILFIKNRLEGGGGNAFLTETSELNIHNIKQLRPKSIGGRTVQVNAGRFVSRVNDAFNIPNPLDNLTAIDTYGFAGQIIRSLERSWTTNQRDKVWTDFINGSREYNINGLEFTYTFHNSPPGLGNSWPDAPDITNITGGTSVYPKYSNGTWPGQSMYGFLAGALESNYLFTTATGQSYYTSETLNTIHLSFVRMWRGVFRTAVVDFPDTTIEIPVFDDDDEYFKIGDIAGQKNDIPGAVQRIDLLVAYSLPIDSSSTATLDFQGNSDPKILTVPTLGIIKGAGIGIKKESLNAISTVDGSEGLDVVPYTGDAKIVGNKGDSSNNAESMGITNRLGIKIHGSFPSPDDLLNIAPLLALNVESDNFQLIGQAALPLAYIVVTKGSTVVTQNDIIDIRPFLRTTEFTYNERAGIAAANPPLSFANPAVGAFQVRDVINQVEDKADQLETKVDSELYKTNGRVLYTDYVMGGLAYGVEGTLLTMCDAEGNPDGPWGNATTTVEYKAADTILYKFNGTQVEGTNFNSSKAFLQCTSQAYKDAYLEYVYNTRQEDLKQWLNDPNANSYNGATYLSTGGTRNIPLYPEWDPPLDSANYTQVMDLVAGADPSAKPTWWMWFEGQGKYSPGDHGGMSRAMAYAPGGFPPPPGTNDQKSAAHTNDNAYLSYFFGFGFSANKNDAAGKCTITVCSKKLSIQFPSWVKSYDVLTEYMNCGPVTFAAATGGDANEYGLGSGLFINKGEITVNSGGKPTAIVTINSAAQQWPEAVDGGAGAIANDGRIRDALKGDRSMQNNNNNTIKFLDDKNYTFLSYSICLPQFKQTKFNVTSQTDSSFDPAATRYTPKFGAAFYPTVKYTIIGYEVEPFSNNGSYSPTSTNNNTAIGNGVNGVNIGAMRIGVVEDGLTVSYQSQAPVPSTPTVIDILDTGPNAGG